MKVQISLDDDLMQRIDDCAERNYISRSGLISLACTQYLQQADLIDAVVRISYSCQKVADTGVADDEIKKQLDDFQRLVHFVVSKQKK